MKSTLILIILLALLPLDIFGQDGITYERSFMQGDSLRTYLLYTPAAYNGETSWPLIINYHGFGIDASFQKDIDMFDLAADSLNFLIAYPNGLIVNDPFEGPGPGWNFDGTISENNDVEFTSLLIDHIAEDFLVDPGSVHATGWSMGAQFIWTLACELPDRIASVAGVSGIMDDALINQCDAGRPYSTMLIHGTADPFFPAEGIEVNGYVFGAPDETVTFWANQNNCSLSTTVIELENTVAEDSSTVTLIEHNACEADSEVLYYRANNAGHQWPGGLEIFPDFLGKANRDINANTEIWNFFKRNPLPQTQGSLEERTLVQGDSVRSYLLYVPEAYDNSSPWPVVLNYHGYTNTAAAQVDVSQMNAAADSANFLVAYPQGLIVNNPFAGSSNFGWNILGGTLSENDDVAFSLNIIDDIGQDYLVDTASIHATGWSMGAGMAYELVCAHADKIASFAVVAEQMDDATIEACDPGRAVPFLQIHGTADPIVPFNGASVAGITLSPTQETALFWADNNSCLSDPVIADIPDLVTDDSSTVSVTAYSGCEDGADVRFYQVNNGGHTWPGGGELPAFVGFVNRDFNASAEMLSFFSGKLPPVVATSTHDEAAVRDIKASVYPNPFRDHFTVDFEIDQTRPVNIKLYNLLGQELSTLINQHFSAGSHRIQWRPVNQNLSTGLYFLRIELGDERLTTSVHYIAN